LKLGRAYETLKDESTRRTYDIIYILIKQKRPATHDTKAPRSHPASEALSEAAQIAALKKSKQERAMRRQIKKTTFELEVTKKQKTVQQLNKEIENLKSITAAELAADTFENSW
jgi:curved DNA-binding protein CbpA